ncbi:type I secretion system permease/ATPase [Noviherbaspirillum sedimenti]|uniref:Cyclolysin secretion/processing ATP-binding protein CyaB n=1 Tax=Noviherbaspirillum sedimenti TaxID=2320865 RepID=A0A3A3GG73_9BURK|nr:type I secretion system permease/ATPase [Noviherbaspirillum sedimenti]RJG01266.1 type I secretion system permease/ATPase [Noviherbaspirillum sedimenti]
MLKADAQNQADPEWYVPPELEEHDDPLLACLLALARLHDRVVNRSALLVGLPLEGGCLTPALFLRAARRIGLNAALSRRALDQLAEALLPVVLLLQGRRACILIRIEGDTAHLLTPEKGATSMPLALLRQCYAGVMLLARAELACDERSAASAPPARDHWLRDALVPLWPLYSEVLLASLMINLFALCMPLFSMNVYDRVVPNQASATLWALTAGMASVTLFDFGMRMLRGYFIDIAGKRIDLQLSSQVFERVLDLRMAARPVSAGAFANNLQEFESVRDFATAATVAALVDLPFVAVFIAAMWWVGGSLAWIPLLAIPIIVVAGLLLQLPLVQLVEASSRLGGQRQAMLVESLVGLEAVKAAGAQGMLQRRWENLLAQMAMLGLKARLLSACALNFAQFVQQTAYLIVIVFGVLQIVEDRLTLGGLIACTILAGRALAPWSQVAALLTRYHQARNALHVTGGLMKLPVEHVAGQRFLQRGVLRGEIEFRNVGFSYPGQQGAALSNVSFSIAAGERVAIIGRIGSGKTTVEKLMMALYEPCSGTVLVDGTDVRQLDPASLRRQIGHVPQDIMLFYGSIRDNIVLGESGVDDEAVLRAAAIGGVADFVSASPQGYDQAVGERGVNLSGGQRQAIAIARAELLAPPILLMDEPSSAMDARSEQLFKDRLSAQIEGRTLVLVSHRGSLLSLVNRVLVLDQGRLVADGPRDAVLAALAAGKLHVAR